MSLSSNSLPPPTPLQAAYALTREIERAPGRAQLGELLRKLSMGMHSVGYFGRERHAQLHGYLIVDQEHERFAEQSMPVRVQPLTNEQRIPLRLAHQELCALNHACVQSVVEQFPEWAQALDPYGFLEVLPPVEPVFDDSYLILSPESISKVAGAFASHFSFPILAEVDPVPTTEYVLQDVQRLESELEYWGAMDSPPFVEAFKKRCPPGLPIRRAFRVVEAIVCLRASLRVLNQLIFQKLKADKLPCLSDQEIFAVPLISMHDTGRGMSIVFQPWLLEHHLQDGELLIVEEIDRYTLSSQKLYLVDRASKAALFSAFSEDGATGYCTLRPVDENLCPFKVMWDGNYDRTDPHEW